MANDLEGMDLGALHREVATIQMEYSELLSFATRNDDPKINWESYRQQARFYQGRLGELNSEIARRS